MTLNLAYVSVLSAMASGVAALGANRHGFLPGLLNLARRHNLLT